MLVTLLTRICDDPHDLVFSAPTGVSRRRVADGGDSGSSYSRSTKPVALICIFDLMWQDEAVNPIDFPSPDSNVHHSCST
jgi:hypothetical protein